MSMQINAASPVAASSRHPLETRHDVKDLRKALRSGNLDAATTAYAAVNSDLPNVATKNPNGAFAQIGTALAAGDMAGAQSAFSNMLKSKISGTIGEKLPPVPAPTDAPVSTSSTSGSVNLTA